MSLWSRRDATGVLYSAIESQDVLKVRTLCSRHPELLERCTKFAAAPRLYAQFGYRAAWWLYTPLQYAALHDSTGLVTSALLELSCDVNNLGALQVSPLHVACSKNNTKVIEVLLGARQFGCEPPDLDLKDARGKTPREVARGQSKKLFDNVVDDIRDDRGSKITEWEVIDFVGPKISVEHPQGCTCIGCRVRPANQGSSASDPEGDGSDASIPTEHEQSISVNEVEEQTAKKDDTGGNGTGTTKSKIKRPFSFKSFLFGKKPEDSPSTDIDGDSIVTFGLVEYDDLLMGREVAKGSFGTVYEAQWHGFRVAVKMIEDQGLLFESRGPQNQSEALVQEIRLFQELKHDNIITFIGACSNDDHFYICTEFASDGSLYDFLHELSNSYDLGLVRRWSIEIARGMDYLASKDILHRDLKSPNILLTNADVAGSVSRSRYGYRKQYDDGPLALTAKICDFGLSHKNTVATKDTKGTCRWMAPEVVTQQEEITWKCDVYSYGIVLWEMLTREIPFQDLENQQVLYAVTFDDERPPIPDSFPVDFQDVVNACWKRNPDERPMWRAIIESLHQCEISMDGSAQVIKSSSACGSEGYPTEPEESTSGNQAEEEEDGSEETTCSSKNTASAVASAVKKNDVQQQQPNVHASLLLSQTQEQWSRQISTAMEKIRSKYTDEDKLSKFLASIASIDAQRLARFKATGRGGKSMILSLRATPSTERLAPVKDVSVDNIDGDEHHHQTNPPVASSSSPNVVPIERSQSC